MPPATRREQQAPAEEAEVINPSGASVKNVTFTRGFGKYVMGDVAGFPPRFADQIITKGVAREATPQDMFEAAHGLYRRKTIGDRT